jgi:tape measure domain-containing protein
MAGAANTIAGINVNLTLQSAAFLRGIQQSTQATAQASASMQKSLKSVEMGFMQTGRAVTQFANGFKSLFAAQLVLGFTKSLIDMADAWTLAQNKIRASSELSGTQARSMEELVIISNRTRSSIDATADIYSKLIRVSDDLGVSENQVARATEIVSKAFKTGGASTLEYENGIRQLAQALGSGILQGDELRSIRENAPVLAEAIAKEFNTTVADLKRLGAEGELTAKRVFQAIVNGEGDIARAFAQTNQTIGDSFTKLTNAMTQYIAQQNQASGTGNALISAINFVADHLSNILSPGLLGAAGDFGHVHTAFRLFMQEVGKNVGQDIDDFSRDIVELGNGSASTATQLMAMAGALKEVYVQASLAQSTDVGSLFKMGIPPGMDKGTYGPEQGLDYERIAQNAIAAEAATHKLVSKQRDWATQVEVTEAGKLQIEAYKNLKDHIEATEQPLAKYQRTLAEVAILERDGALTAQQAFAARVQSSAEFTNTFLGAASAMSGALTSLFKENKAIAIANAVINTAEAISAALKNPPGPPFSFVYAAAAAVAGAAQIAAIVSAQPGNAKTPGVKGGGGKKVKAVSDAGASSTSASPASAKPSQAVHITLTGEGGFSREQVRTLIGQLNEAVGDGAVLKVSQ